MRRQQVKKVTVIYETDMETITYEVPYPPEVSHSLEERAHFPDYFADYFSLPPERDYYFTLHMPGIRRWTCLRKDNL